MNAGTTATAEAVAAAKVTDRLTALPNRTRQPSDSRISTVSAAPGRFAGTNAAGVGRAASVTRTGTQLIGADELADLQKNIVLSHAAGVGAAMPARIARLMMALKLASLAQGLG